jgi:hypothetical protein
VLFHTEKLLFQKLVRNFLKGQRRESSHGSQPVWQGGRRGGAGGARAGPVGGRLGLHLGRAAQGRGRGRVWNEAAVFGMKLTFQTNGVAHRGTFRQGWTPVSLSTPDGSEQAVASPHASHKECWQPVLSWTRPLQVTNLPYDTSHANQWNVTCSERGEHQCPGRPHWQMCQDKLWSARTQTSFNTEKA